MNPSQSDQRATVQVRVDPISGHRVLIAPDRRHRPYAFAADTPVRETGSCPFCPGHEQETPPEIDAIRRPPADGPDWDLRVVPNKYPALLTRPGFVTEQRSDEGLFSTEPGLGVHEVLIEHPVHTWNWASGTVEEIARILRVLRDRMRLHSRDSRWAYTQVFRNEGREAGASLAHAHTQILALPFVPEAILREVDRKRAHRDRSGRCLFCDVIDAERRDGSRWVLDGDGYGAFEPFAPRFSFETWVFPLEHVARFEDTTDNQLDSLADVFSRVYRRLTRRLGPFDHNLILHTKPAIPEDSPFHWHWELTTRLGRVAGFERATDVYINSVPPESAAAQLRAAEDTEAEWDAEQR